MVVIILAQLNQNCSARTGDGFWCCLGLSSSYETPKLTMRYMPLAPGPDEIRPRRSPTCLFISMSLAAFILTGLVLFFKDTIYKGFQDHVCSSPYTQMTNFEDTQAFQTLSQDNDGLWAQLIPSNGGFHFQTLHGNDSYRLGIAMFHELHCLRMLRNRLQSLTQRVELLSNVTDPDYPGYVKKPIDSVHVLHCLDYLRQVS